jgi:sulfur-oxidizing protein SoxZ
MANALVRMPERARRGEIIEIRTLINHVMEHGHRRTETGALIPRNILTLFSVFYNGEEIFHAELHPAIAANPYFAFTTVATESGSLIFTWSGDNGFTLTTERDIEVE